MRGAPQRVTPTILTRYAWGYDPAGNRLYEQVDDTVTGWTYDSLNRLVTQYGGGTLQFAGNVNEPATVTIQGQQTSVSPAGAFAGGAAVVSGSNLVTIQATDAAGNTATANYQTAVGASTKAFDFDPAGNLISDGQRTFEWNARNDLNAVTVGTNRTEFVYDGLRHRTRIVERESGTVQADTAVVWCQEQRCEVRAANGAAIISRHFGDAEQKDAPRFLVRDHLGSVTDVTNTAGELIARYTFDPWGKRSLTAGAATTSVGYTGHEASGLTGLTLAPYRAYEPGLAVWISEDPMGIDGGLNLYSYVGGQPVRSVDPLGLVKWSVTENPPVEYVKMAQIKGCGKISVTGDGLTGSCTCVGGTWKANLAIDIVAKIQVANDTLITPKSTILAHERRHWAAIVKVARQAKAAGEGVEQREFRSKDACDAAINEWRMEWLPKINSAGAHNLAQGVFWGMTCI